MDTYKCLQEISEKKFKWQFSKRNNSEMSEESYWSLTSFELKKTLFLSYVKLLGNFMDYFKEGEDIFDYKNYIESTQPYKKEFIKQFVQTQNFVTFIEKARNCLEKSNEISYFIKAAKIYKSIGIKTLKKELDKIIDYTIYNNNVFYYYQISQ